MKRNLFWAIGTIEMAIQLVCRIAIAGLLLCGLVALLCRGCNQLIPA